MKKYVVMHHYNSEGWQIVGEYDALLDAVLAREDDVESIGGQVVIFQFLHPLWAYATANATLSDAGSPDERSEAAP